jgi:hypothetical protein
MRWCALAWRIATDRQARGAAWLLFTDDPPHSRDRRAALRVLVDALHVNDVYVLEQLARFRQLRRLVRRQRRRLQRLERVKGGA